MINKYIKPSLKKSFNISMPDINIIGIKKNEIKDFPTEIKQIIISYLLLYERKNNIIKSNQYNKKFIKYDPGELNSEIDWDKYKIGDCVIYRGWTSRAYTPKSMYIRSWCIKCKCANNEQINKVCDYFDDKYNYKYTCKSCREVERYRGMAILADTGYKICRNCYKRFKYIDWNKEWYCNWCQTLRVYCGLNKKYNVRIETIEERYNYKNISAIDLHYF
jgi:hypothetical protein